MISIVIPVYNAEKYLSECFASLENQTCKNFEIVIIDDGSTDSSPQLCDDFAKNSKHHVVVRHTPNQGQLLAHRLGIQLSSGEYVAFLDADDCFRSDAIQTMEKTIAECHPDIIAFNCCRSAEVTFNGKPPSNYGLNPGFYTGESFFFVKEAACSGLFNSLATKVIKRSLFDLQVDYSIWKGLMHGEDFIQVLPVVGAAQSLVYLNETLYFYREHLQSSTRSFDAKQIHDLDLVFARLFPFAKSWDGGCVKSAKQAVCRHAVWLLFNLAHTQDNKREKEEDARKIAHLVTKYCSYDLRQTISSLRIEMRILLVLLLKGSFNAAFLLARIVFKLSEIINH